MKLMFDIYSAALDFKIRGIKDSVKQRKFGIEKKRARTHRGM